MGNIANKCPICGAAPRYKSKMGMDSYNCQSMFVAGTDELITGRQGWACKEIQRMRKGLVLRDMERWLGPDETDSCAYCGEERGDKNVSEPCNYDGCETVTHPWSSQ